jgi:glycine cleavage system H protein
MVERRSGPHGEWLEREGDVVTVGITRIAAEQLGNVVGVHFPEVTTPLHRGEVAVVLESSKAAVDCETPISGTVKAINFQLLESPDLLNEVPEHDGWLYRLENIDDREWEKLPLQRQAETK